MTRWMTHFLVESYASFYGKKVYEISNVEIKIYNCSVYFSSIFNVRWATSTKRTVHLNENDRVGRQSTFDFFLYFPFQWVLYSRNYSFKLSVPLCNQWQINGRFGTNNVLIVTTIRKNRSHNISFSFSQQKTV